MKNNVSFNSELAKFGIGLFETIKVTNYPLDLDLHINRLYNSAKELNLNINKEKEFYKKTILEYIKENNILLSDIIKKIKNGESITLKEDKLNHGMGLKNVRNAVENYNGSIEIYLKDYWFVVEINI